MDITKEENKFKIGDLVIYYNRGVWKNDGVVVWNLKNCSGKNLVRIRTSNGSILVLYESEIMLRK